jgi:hypothetical protein
MELSLHIKIFFKINLAKDALNVMAYCIFLKSMESLEEFRKNPHVQIPSKSPCKNSQSLAKSQIPLNLKINFREIFS